MKTFRYKRICSVLSCTFLILLFLCLQFKLFINITSGNVYKNSGKEQTIIWWTPFITGERLIQCKEVVCFVTDNRALVNNAELAFLFYGTHFNKSDLPLPRNYSIWGLLHEESPRNSPLLNHEAVLRLFNYSSTFSRFSDLPLTVQYLPSLESITSLDFYKSFRDKNSYNISPVVYIQSDCITPNNRDSYVRELMKYIKVDSFGKCLNNKKLPKSLDDPLPNMMSPDLLNLIGHYKFAIAFENALCEDYITEKLWRPLIVGTIPLYIGSSSVKDWIPNNNSIILPLDFHSPMELAKYLHYVGSNADIYDNFRKHKLMRQIDNSFLIENFNNYQALVGERTFVEEFECLICQKLHKNEFGNVNKKHYNCPEPYSIVSNTYNASNWWHDDYVVSKCEANFLYYYINQGFPISRMKFKC